MSNLIESCNPKNTTALICSLLMENIEDKNRVLRRFAVSFQTILFSKLDKEKFDNVTSIPVLQITRVPPYVEMNTALSVTNTVQEIMTRYVKFVFRQSKDQIDSNLVVRAVLPSLIVALLDFVHIQMIAVDIIYSALELFQSTYTLSSTSWSIQLRRSLATLVGRCAACLISTSHLRFFHENHILFRGGLTSSAMKTLEPYTFRDRLKDLMSRRDVSSVSSSLLAETSSSLRCMESYLRRWASQNVCDRSFSRIIIACTSPNTTHTSHRSQNTVKHQKTYPNF